MATQGPHTKILNAAAREGLRSMGVQQKGRSRFWYDDGRWYAIAIEFQPSEFSQGTYLNTGVHWLWYPKDTWSFDLGYRNHEFIEFEHEAQFREAALRLVELATARVKETRSRLSTLSEAYDYARRQPEGDWSGLHLGILAALTGNVDAARALISDPLAPSSDISWMQERNRYIETLLEVVDDVTALRPWVEGRIAECRALLKLEELPTPVLPER